MILITHRKHTHTYTELGVDGDLTLADFSNPLPTGSKERLKGKTIHPGFAVLYVLRKGEKRLAGGGMVDPTRSYPVPHVADSEHDKIDQPVGPLANDPSRPSNLTLHRAHPVFTGQKAEDRPASDSDVNAAPPQTQNYECVISKSSMLSTK